MKMHIFKDISLHWYMKLYWLGPVEQAHSELQFFLSLVFLKTLKCHSAYQSLRRNKRNHSFTKNVSTISLPLSRYDLYWPPYSEVSAVQPEEEKVEKQNEEFPTLVNECKIFL